MRDNQILKYIGARLKTERERLRFSQEDFAQLARCSQPTYSRIERGERDVGIIALYRLACQLQLPIDALLPPSDEGYVDTSETELIEAWRDKDLTKLLALVAERFS